MNTSSFFAPPQFIYEKFFQNLCKSFKDSGGMSVFINDRYAASLNENGTVSVIFNDHKTVPHMVDALTESCETVRYQSPGMFTFHVSLLVMYASYTGDTSGFGYRIDAPNSTFYVPKDAKGVDTKAVLSVLGNHYKIKCKTIPSDIQVDAIVKAMAFDAQNTSDASSAEGTVGECSYLITAKPTGKFVAWIKGRGVESYKNEFVAAVGKYFKGDKINTSSDPHGDKLTIEFVPDTKFVHTAEPVTYASIFKSIRQRLVDGVYKGTLTNGITFECTNQCMCTETEHRLVVLIPYQVNHIGPMRNEFKVLGDPHATFRNVTVRLATDGREVSITGSSWFRMF